MIVFGHVFTLGALAVVGGLGAMILASEAGRALESRRAPRTCPFCKGAGCEHCGTGTVDDRELRAKAVR